jgi:hypothetical protein
VIMPSEAELDALEDAAEALELEAEAERASADAEGPQRRTLGCEWVRGVAADGR